LSNFLSIVNYNQHIYLVIYTDEYSAQFLPQLATQLPAVAIRLKPLEKFHMYKYADHWRRNHEQNYALKMTTSWELNMLWSEKLWFLREVIDDLVLPPTPYYAYCDAGYFRNRVTGPLLERDLHSGGGIAYNQWANPQRMGALDRTKIHYALVNQNVGYIRTLKTQIQQKDPKTRLPICAIPPNQVSIGGGFCLLAPELISGWCEEYEFKLEDYFTAKATVKDDQIILADCIFSNDNNTQRFFLVSQAPTVPYDPWFVFQRFLM